MAQSSFKYMVKVALLGAVVGFIVMLILGLSINKIMSAPSPNVEVSIEDAEILECAEPDNIELKYLQDKYEKCLTENSEMKKTLLRYQRVDEQLNECLEQQVDRAVGLGAR